MDMFGGKMWTTLRGGVDVGWKGTSQGNSNTGTPNLPLLLPEISTTQRLHHLLTNQYIPFKVTFHCKNSWSWLKCGLYGLLILVHRNT